MFPSPNPEREHTNTHAHKRPNSSVSCWSLSTDIRAKPVRSATATTQTRSPDSQTCRWFVIPEVTGSWGGGVVLLTPLCVWLYFSFLFTQTWEFLAGSQMLSEPKKVAIQQFLCRHKTDWLQTQGKHSGFTIRWYHPKRNIAESCVEAALRLDLGMNGRVNCSLWLNANPAMRWQIAFGISAFCHAAGLGTVALVAGFLIATGRQMSHFEFIRYENCGQSSAVNQNNQE